ncbi:MAG: N-acetyl sugar amidotransferase [Verrucomicrobia bacterium]|nr:N-acetyl sugar amidotransferase [Verrucomicrobiota bacterium]
MRTVTPYRICSNCVMDTSDPRIVFDERGVCDHCRGFYRDVLPNWHPNERGKEMFRREVAAIKKQARGKPYDCIMGMSGGLDSSYLLHLAVAEFGLRPLVFHVDGGWNTDIAVNNIQMLVEKLGLELFTEVISWPAMRDFQLAFFKSGTPHLDIPQDHAFFGTMFHFANKYGVKCILNGGNFSTECIRNPKDWLYYGTDMPMINDIRARFCTTDMEGYPFSGILYHKVFLRYVKGIRVVRPLNYLPYTKATAIQTLSEKYGWKSYPQKHFESRFTKFYEGYWLPTRFGYDTRRVQYSSLIVTEQMTRAEALKRLESPPYDPAVIDEEFEYIATKLGIGVEELQHYHQMPLKWFRDYKNQEWLFDLGARVMKLMGLERAIKR